MGDDLYGQEPWSGEVQLRRMRFVLVATPPSHPARFAQVAEREQRGGGVHGTWTEGTGPRRPTLAYRTAAALALTQSGMVRVNCLEVWEQRPEGTIGYHNSGVTDFVVTPETVAAIVGIGRSCWKIENEPFNVQNNQGYELEPNYGHGQPTLSMVFSLLNLLAFLAHQLLEFGDRLYQQGRAGESRRGLWTSFRSAFSLLAFDTWEARFRYHLREGIAGP